MLAQLKKDFPDDLQVVYRHFPLLSIHDKAALATQAAEAAGAQDKFWEMHDLLYFRQNEWAGLPEADFRTWLNGEAEAIGLDLDQFSADLDSDENVAFVQEVFSFGSEVGLPGTPFMVVNDSPYGGPLDYQNLTAILKLYLLEDRQYSECPPITIDPLNEYIATLTTEKGEITIQLYPERALLAVNSFIFLAQEGWFDGVSFHRVIPGFVAQAGDPTGTGFGGPGYAFDNEIAPDLSFNDAGIVAMANAGPGSNGSQFFITYDSQPDLDGKFTIFGEVLSGMEVVESLTPRNAQLGGNQPAGDQILSVTIEVR